MGSVRSHFGLEKLMTDAIEPLSGEAAASVPVNPDLRWYIVHAYSGMEKAVEPSALIALVCKISLVVSWFPPKKWWK